MRAPVSSPPTAELHELRDQAENATLIGGAEAVDRVHPAVGELNVLL